MIDKNHDDKVGYCNPPKQHRFKPGQSGNPKGRPKKRKNLPAHVNHLLRKKMRITEQGETRSATGHEAVALILMTKALKGEQWAVKMVMDLERQHIDPDEFADSVDVESIVMDYLSKESDSKGADNEE